ncbi:MAG: hypothetical protein J6K75_05930 [Erysipelotrichaceae bacterium]|nr:hypothetical protein [Erysipelotrichaceae bacterium]MBQ7888621.1 hypothetical protein [Erysipelotrichaceae bacterium]
MIEIKPWMIGDERFLGVLIYLPKVTMRMLVNMKMICLDECFNLHQIEKRCSVPLIRCSSGSFEKMMNQPCKEISVSAKNLGIHESMSVKEAVACVFQQK